MIEIKEFINNYEKVMEIIKNESFTNPLLFKGFSEKDKNNFNLLVENENDSSKVINKESQFIRKSNLKNKIENLINCKVTICTRKQFHEIFLKKLEDNNSILLTSNINEESIIKTFGENWKFNRKETSNIWNNLAKDKEENLDSNTNELTRNLSNLSQDKQILFIENLIKDLKLENIIEIKNKNNENNKIKSF